MNRVVGVLLLALSFTGSLKAQSESHVKAIRSRSSTAGGQEFFCVGTYSAPQCDTQVAVLRTVLRKYNSERLGKWSWIVVRSEDWKQFVSQLGLHPSSPASTHIGNRQTFLDEALIVLKPKRELELRAKWNIPFGQLLDFAVSHELAHAFCEEPDEVEAENLAQRLRKGLPGDCKQKKTHGLRADVP